MFLRRLVVHGFKSFADRTEFEFGPGMTSIVGPNGCGKSNVLDATRWVLGEQSAKTLRGTRMTDVVFNGSRSRKPADFAEVELTFDNTSGLLSCDESEVAVARTLYRSGESEYRINGRVCRLKDVRDLLLDTGVGVDAYSVIEQGKVDKLLASSPNERREIFEEAAGVSRYKMRRVEAQRKLERAQNNLLRLNDLIDELDKRLRSVKLAAGKARNYQEYDARLRELRSAYALSEYAELQQRRGEERGRWESYQDLVDALRADLGQRDQDAAAADRALRRVDAELREVEAALAEVQAEQAAMVERGRQSERRRIDLESQRHAHDARIAELQQQTATLQQRVLEARQALDEVLAAETQERARLEQARDAASAAQLACDAVRREVGVAQSAASNAGRQAALARRDHETLVAQQPLRVEALRRTRAQCSELSAAAAAQNETVARLETARGEWEANREQAEQALGALDEQAQRVALELRSVGADCERLREQRSGLLSQLSLLEELEQRREGVDQATAWLLDWRQDADSDGTVAGLVADLLQVDDERVALLQSVLARIERCVVVRESHPFVSELQRRGDPPGRVDVLALDRLPVGGLPDGLVGAPGVLARVLDWVRCEPEFRPLAERLLGRVFLVDGLIRAFALADHAPDGCVFVTPAGEVVAAGGRVTLGAARDVPGLISRRFEIRRLRGAADDVEMELQRLQRAKAELEASAADLTLQRDAKRADVQGLQRQLIELRGERQRALDEQARSERELSRLCREITELEREVESLVVRIAALDGAAAQADARERESAASAEELAARLPELQGVAAERTQDWTAAQIELGRVAERRKGREAALHDLTQRAAAVEGEQARALRAAAESVERLAACDLERTQTAARIAELARSQAQVEKSAQSLRNHSSELRRRLDAAGAVVQRLRETLDGCETALRQSEVTLREIDVRRETLQQRVRDELAIDLAELFTRSDAADCDWDAVRAEIEELRGKLTRLGNVNLDSLQELAELTPRCDAMQAQRADLLASIAELEQLIAELDDESRRRFSQCFEEVRENFIELFRKLFGGGKADIVLEDPERPLECGIEIIARPPGKEPQSLSLLSGGEKTMTTVALLFAIFKRKPSPFAILDEVDAALDESNIGRFNGMLQEFLSGSQFIVITHNKRTMQFAGALYGVTMQEPGVSKRVSVRFDDRVQAPIVA